MKNLRNMWLTWFKNLRLWKKILLAFLLSSILPLLMVQGIMLYINSKNMQEKMDELMSNQLRQTAERVELTLDIYTNVVYQAYMDSELVQDINYLLEKENPDKEMRERDIYERIQEYGMAAEGIHCISIVTRDGQDVTYDFVQASVVENIWSGCEDMREIPPCRAAREASGVVITPTTRVLDGEKEYRAFHISKKIYDYQNLGSGEIAVIVMSVDEKVLDNICTAGQEKQEEGEYSLSFITDSSGNVMSYPDSFYSGIPMNPKYTPAEFVQATGRMKDRELAVNTYYDAKLGWTFYNVYDKNYMLRDVGRTQSLILGVGLLITLMAVGMIVYTVRLIERSIGVIMAGIRQVQEGNLEVQVETDSRDEFGEIAENFNTMTGKVRNLIREIQEVGKKQREAEIRALEAQINPHFLYNTLDSINWMAIDKGEYEISRMLRDLGVILRYSVNKSNQMVPLWQAADWLEKYVGLQQMRFNHAFSFELHMDEKAGQVHIYKLLLQPFVENCIVHGFRGIQQGGMLRVDMTVSEEQGMLCIIVEDNGNGMPQEEVRKYNLLNQEIQDDGRSIGLINAFSRMRMYYGSRVSWNVSSIPEVGTIITLKIPVEEG